MEKHVKKVLKMQSKTSGARLVKSIDREKDIKAWETAKEERKKIVMLNDIYDFPFNFESLLWLLHFCVKNDILAADPDNRNHIIVYRDEGSESLEGWYSENAHDIAREMCADENMTGQRSLLQEIDKRGLKLNFTPEPYIHIRDFI